jgi:leucokinin receptor
VLPPQVLSVNVSVFTLTAIAVDRHRAIVKPLRGARPSSLRARLTLASIWVLGGGLALPMTIAMRVTHVQQADASSKPFCYNTNLSQDQMMMYRRVLVALQYFVPLCVISAVYARMGFHLWGSKTPGNAENMRDANLLRNKKRVSRSK